MMRNKIINNIAIIIIVVVLLMSISVITYMGIQSFKISNEAKLLNDTVQTSSNIGEIGSLSTSKKDFIDRLNEVLPDFEVKGDTVNATLENGVYFTIKLSSEEKPNGTMYVYHISATFEDDEIYSLQTNNYVSNGRQGDNQ